MLVRVLHRNRINRVCRERYRSEEIYSRNWLIGLWMPKSPIICGQQTGAPGKLVGNSSPNPKAWDSRALMPKDKRRRTAQLRQRASLPFLCLSVLFRPSVDWVMPTHIEGDLHRSVYWFKYRLFQKYLHTHTPKNDVTNKVAHKTDHHGSLSPNNALCDKVQFSTLKFKTKSVFWWHASFSKCLLSTYHMPGIVLGNAEILRGEGHGPAFLKLTISEDSTYSKI